jgi:hypothetical protein
MRFLLPEIAREIPAYAHLCAVIASSSRNPNLETSISCICCDGVWLSIAETSHFASSLSEQLCSTRFVMWSLKKGRLSDGGISKNHDTPNVAAFPVSACPSRMPADYSSSQERVRAPDARGPAAGRKLPNGIADHPEMLECTGFLLY